MALIRLGGGQLAARLLVAAFVLWPRTADGAAPRGFVARAGSGFVLDGAPFHVVGANQYNLMTATSFGGAQAQMATGALDNAQALGVNVMRTWAFCDGSRPGALQPQAGAFSEDTFRALDSVIAQARDRNVRLLLVLTNYWQDYGGIGEYVSWASSSGEYLRNKEDFFSSPACRQLFRNFATALLTRVNTITGVAYRDDPTIFAWELINEPRVPQDWSGDVLQSWIADLAAHIKSVDPAHMLTTGVEGFFGPSTPEQQGNNPYGGSEGTDFRRNHDIDAIDFTVAHVWADQWKRNSNCDQRCLVAFIKQWHVSHLAESARLGKPFILEEFGAPRWWRDEVYSSTYDITYGSALNGGAVGGDMLWLLAGSSSVPDYDTYTVYPGDSSTRALVKMQAARMRQLDVAGTPPPPPPPPPPQPVIAEQTPPLAWPRLAAPYPGQPPLPPSPQLPVSPAGESS